MSIARVLSAVIVGVAGFATTSPLAAQELIWDTTRHQRSQSRTTSPSRSIESGGKIIADTEIADDFLAVGTIERIVLQGTSGSIADVEASGVTVRFYEWTASGPGSLLSATTLTVGDPGLNVDVDDPRTFDITLPTPFVADGWHFIAVQPHVDAGGWSPIESNTQLGSYVPINAPAYFRDNLAGGTWAQDTSFGALEFSDIRMELFGTAIPLVESVTSTSPATPSGRLVIMGSAFGGAPDESTVLIDGREAIVTQRFGQEMRAYVPEQTAIGNVNVQVINGQGASATTTIDVVPRTADGRIRWRFQIDRWMSPPQNQKIGPDGRIYTSDQIGLYALAPNGELLWFVPGAGGGYPIDIGADGTIYTGSVSGLGHCCRIYAIEPDGDVKWIFDGPQDSDGNYFLENGPSVGPDGNIYAIQNKLESGDAGLGMFSLDPDGDVRWSNPGSPLLRNYASGSNEAPIVFANDRLYTGFQYGFSGSPQTLAFDFEGSQLWFTGPEDLNVSFFSHPRVSPAGNAIGRFGTGLISLNPNGSTRFARISPGQFGTIQPAVDEDGNVYTARAFGVGLWSVDEDGTERWIRTDGPGAQTDRIGVAPGGQTIMTTGGPFGSSEIVRGYAAANGDFLWEFQFEDELGVTQSARNRAFVFADDGTTAYCTTSFNDNEIVFHGYLYAIQIADSIAVSPYDLNGDGIVGFGDLTSLIAAWGSPAADFDGDGTTGTSDLIALLANWTT